MLKVSTPNPMPERLLLEFAEGLDQVMAVEELDPVLEQELLLLSGRHHLPLEVKGKLTGEVQTAGENSVESVRRVLEEYLGEAISGIWKDWKAVQRSRKQPCRFRRCRCVRRYSVPDVPTGHPSTR